MNESIRAKLKKYVLYISAIFFVIIGSHLIYNYSYDGAESEAIEWGSISEAIIGSFPSFNPLVPSNDHNAYINDLLYRSLLEYSTVSWNFESDLASCDRENLLYITCSIDANAIWSDGTAITPEDIKATLNIIKETKVNPIIASLLEWSVIETSNDTITFTNTTKDINFLQVLLQPILPAKVVERLDSDNIDGKFSEINGVYSGRYTLASISQDETVGITKITLWKNENYFENDMYIQFLILNLFRDETHFLKNKNSFNIFNDKEWIIAGSVPRLEDKKYTLSQFVWSFFNSETLDLELRKYISNTLDRTEVIEAIWEDNVEKSLNPFLSDINIDTDISDFDLDDYMKSKGYFSKTSLLKNVIALEEQRQQEESESSQLMSNEVQIAPVIQTPQIVQSELNYIISPTKNRYNFISEDNVLITWRVDPWVDAVYIGDYQLSWFSSWDDIFYYRLLESYDSIIEGENTYELFFEIDGEKKFIEEFTYVYYTDSNRLAEIQNWFFAKADSTEFPKEEIWNEVTQTSTPISQVEIEDLNLSSNDIQWLSESLYYNASWEPFSITLVYTQADASMESGVQRMKSLLEENWIAVVLSVVDLWDITVKLRNETLDYDVMVLWINLGYFDSNIFPYFHSSQVQNWYNFANFKKLSVDILLEELKSNNLEISKKEELEEKMLDIIKDDAIVKVFYTPKLSLLVDKNIKNFNFPKFIPDSKDRYYPLLQSYLTEKRMINSEDKSIGGFFVYLIKQLFS